MGLHMGGEAPTVELLAERMTPVLLIVMGGSMALSNDELLKRVDRKSLLPPVDRFVDGAKVRDGRAMAEARKDLERSPLRFATLSVDSIWLSPSSSSAGASVCVRTPLLNRAEKNPSFFFFPLEVCPTSSSSLS